MPGIDTGSDTSRHLEQLAISEPKFVDTEFPTGTFNWQSLKKTKVYWKRPHDLCSSPSLFGDIIDAAYVRQGRLGDCFFIAALSLVCSKEEAIRKLFMNTSEIQASGMYRFQFFEFGTWQTVVIDDQLPTRNLRNRKGYQLVLGRTSQNNTFWVSLIEKAYAKLYGSYESIRGGNISEALADLTGAPVNDYNLDATNFRPKQFWGMLREQQANGAMIGCAFCQKDVSNSEDDNEDDEANGAPGIQLNHAYTVQLLLDVEFDGKKRKLVLVKNPQRDGQRVHFAGTFSDPNNWTEQTTNALSEFPLYPGVFWMTWKEFRDQFNRLYVCQYEMLKTCQVTTIQDLWEEGTSGGCTDYASWRTNPAFEISGEILAISLQQPDRRRQLREDSQQISYPMIGLTIVKEPRANGNPFLITSTSDILGRTSFWNKRDVAIEVSGEWPTPFVAVPSHYEPNLTGKFVMNIYSKGEARICKRQLNLNQARCTGRWTEATAGGGPLASSFAKNPKFILNIENTGNLSTSGTLSFFIGLRQVGITKENRHKIGICVLKKAKYALEALEGLYGSLDKSWFLGSTTFDVREEVNRTLEVTADQLPVLIIPCTWEKNQALDFELTIYTRETIPVVEIIAENDSL